MSTSRIRTPSGSAATLASVAASLIIATGAAFPQAAHASHFGASMSAVASTKHSLRTELHVRLRNGRALRRCRRRHDHRRCARQRAALRRATRRISILRADLGLFDVHIADNRLAGSPRASDASRRVGPKSGKHISETTSTTTTSTTTTTMTTTTSSTTSVSSSSTAESTSTSTSTTTSSSGSGEFGPFIKGIDTNLQGWGVEAMPQIASEMRELGVNWAREDLSWSTVEETKGVFNWSSFDKIVAAAKENGITILPIVGYAPAWAGPEDAAEYAAFVKAAVERYGPGTSANLQWWELWNEPYFSYAWSGHTPDPEAYARDYAAAAEAARSVSPTVKTLIAADYQDSPQTGGTTPWETSWISDMFTAVPSLGKLIDGVSVHPYGDNPALPLAKPGGWLDDNGEWAFQRIDTIREKFLERDVNVPFWITEEGWSTSVVSEATQADYYKELVPQVAARPWIRALFPYCLREFSSSGGKESQFGLLKFGTWQPKPAFDALRAGLATLG